MTNKLTREVLDLIWDRGRECKDIMDRVFELATAHTAECVAEAVAEAVAEIKKDHFRIGEHVLVNAGTKGTPNWIDGLVGANKLTDASELYTDRPEWVRRPPRTRKMTDDELRKKIEFGEVGFFTARLSSLSRPTLEAMAKDLQISIEVEVE